VDLTHSDTFDDAAWLAAYDTQAGRIRSLHLEALMGATAGKEYGVGERQREAGVLLDLERPDRIRVTGALPAMSSRGFEMASDGKEFRLLIPENGTKRFFIGPADSRAASQNPRENLRPEPFLNALLWRDGKLLKLSATKRMGSGDRTLTVELPKNRSGVESAEIDWDRVHGVVRSLTVYDAAGTMISQATYSDWAMVDASPEESAGGGCFPRQVQVLEPAQHYEVTLRILRVLFHANVPQSAFHPSPPPGVPVVPVLGPAVNDTR